MENYIIPKENYKCRHSVLKYNAHSNFYVVKPCSLVMLKKGNFTDCNRGVVEESKVQV